MFVSVSTHDLGTGSVERAGRIAISPRARKLARDNHLDLASLSPIGSGSERRIIARDVLAALGKNAPLAKADALSDTHETGLAGISSKNEHVAVDLSIAPEPKPSPTISNPLQALMADLEAISEAYADKAGFARTPDWFVLKLQEEMGELTQAYLKTTARSGKGALKSEALLTAHEALERELGDVFGQLLLLANALDIDPVAAVCKKWGVNAP